ncbi:MAG: PAS domain S-box protein [Nitrospirae bacterium]|nr:PAS domain S-box protein [Nitrospirota bacterium]
MKRKIIITLGIASLLFIGAGIYIVVSIENTTSELDNLIKLHQVEILREHLLIRIKRVQSDLNLKGTRYARGIDTIVKDVMNMGDAVQICFACHHSEDVTERLVELKDHVGQYKNGLSRVLTVRANASRLDREEDEAFRIGEELIGKVNTMIALTQKKLTERTEHALREISRTKIILFILVVSGPLLAGGAGILFIRGVTKPVSALLNATRKLKGGDLGYRVGPLKDEFGEVADSFNEMAGSLKEQMFKMEESEKRYRALFERAGDGIFMIDTEGEGRFRIVAANHAAAEMHGHTVEELLTMQVADLDGPEEQETHSLFDRIIKGDWINAGATHRRKDGSVFPVEISAGPLELSNHRYVLAFARDITERKLAEEALQRAEQLKVAGDLAAGLTHELKNSLAGIKVSVEVLLDELALSEDDRTVLKNMIQEIRRIELLMKDLLNFARPSKPQLTFVNINTVLDTAMTFSLKNVSSSDNARPITAVKNLDQRLPRTMADPMQLQQVFMNLLLNAVESMSEGGSLTVKTAYEKAADLIHISISDTGKGIEEELAQKIFEPFFTTKPKGTGLGLSITKRLIEQHNGKIRITKNFHSGATFEIALPVKHFEEADVA